MIRVLIIEADPRLRILFRAAIKFQGCEVLITETLEKATEIIKSEDIKLVMADTSTADFANLTKSTFKEPLFLLTDLPIKESGILAKAVGAEFWLNPLDGSIGSLIKKVRSTIHA